MKRNPLYLLLILSVPACLYFGALAQDGSGDAAGKDTTSIEKRDGDKLDTSSGKEGATAIDKGGSAGTKSDEAKREARKKAERKKKEVKKQAEKKPEKKAEEKKETVRKEELKEEIPEENLDRESGDSLLLIDHEGIKYNRIPDITIKAEEPGQDLVKIPDDKITDSSKEKQKSEGIFGKKTSAIAGWAIVIFIFLIFAIYSKTRTRRSRRKGSRIITKR
ncbi:MAG TPA: hypothetical protein PKN50_11645 [Spirochaetota bacterium]|jgi:hypothetical protein|nr:hypothetical protein [Spirochaetota bacterium]HPV43192.1 hypothetical protein [Spirochaetota bacterium]